MSVLVTGTTSFTTTTMCRMTAYGPIGVYRIPDYRKQRSQKYKNLKLDHLSVPDKWSFFEAKSLACKGDFARKGKRGSVCIMHEKKGAQSYEQNF